MRSLKAAICGILLASVGLYVYTAICPVPRARAQTTFAPLQCSNFKSFSVSANAVLFTANNSTQFIYICSIIINNGNAAAQAVSIVEGTGVTCGTNTQAVIGNSTAAGGLSLGPNSGQNLGGGIGPVARTVVPGDNVCLFTAAGPIAGAIGAAQQPF